MQSRLARHFLPAETIVLGFRLQPFTLWHWRTLSALESPVVGEGQVDLPDLLFAALLCSRPPFAPLPNLRGWRIRLRAALARLRCDPLTEFAVLLEYLEHYKSGPFSLAADNAPLIKTHPALYLAAGLMRLGMGSRDAWCETPGLARWVLAAAAEAEGRELVIVGEENVRVARAAGYTDEEMGL